jgi:hypothetical protein
MRSLRYVPFTFLAGIHGFALFAPYLAFFLTASLLIQRRRSAIPTQIPIPVNSYKIAETHSQR